MQCFIIMQHKVIWCFVCFLLEQEDEEASTGSHLKLIVDAFLQQLPNCVNRDLIDKVQSYFSTHESIVLDFASWLGKKCNLNVFYQLNSKKKKKKHKHHCKLSRLQGDLFVIFVNKNFQILLSFLGAAGFECFLSEFLCSCIVRKNFAGHTD